MITTQPVVSIFSKNFKKGGYPPLLKKTEYSWKTHFTEQVTYSNIPFSWYPMVTGEDSVQVPRQDGVEDQVEEETQEGEDGWRHEKLWTINA